MKTKTHLRILELADILLRAKCSYYQHPLPKDVKSLVISDQEYDTYESELKLLDPENAVLKMVGAPVSLPTEWKKVAHQIPMGSLDKVNTPEELIDWTSDKQNEKDWFVVQKLDGISIEVVYEKGQLVLASTRGSGYEGENIEVNVRRMRGVQSSLANFTGSIRGEIVLTKSVWKSDFPEKSNPRNAAAGIAKRLDGVGSDKLSVMFYQCLGNVEFETEEEQFAWLKKQGLPTPDFWHFKTAEEINSFWRSYQDNERRGLDWDIDGLVVRINDLNLQQSLGERDLRPKGAIAFKFDNEMVETTLLDIQYEVGSMGRITPIAIVEPTMVCGAEVRRASLYNQAYIETLQLDMGARVLITRANEVIPRIEAVIEGTDSVAKPPTNCPECQTTLISDGEYLVCPNTDFCPAQIIGRLKNWIAEISVLEWGETLLEKLVRTGAVSNVADLYKLTIDDLAKIDRMGKKSATNCYHTLWAAKEVSLEVFLGALSIPLIGQASIKAISATGCDTLEKFLAMSAGDFEKVPMVGSVKAKSLEDGLKKNAKLISELLENGVIIKEKIMGNLSGKSFCFTGKMENKRSALEQQVLDAGGEVKGSAGKGLSYLVTADVNGTSTKLEAARKNGTTLISEVQFLEMVK